MKKILCLITCLLLLSACENQAITDAARSTGDAVVGQSGGIDMGDAALGAVGGMMLGNMMSGSNNSHHTTTIIKEKKVYVQPSTPRTSAPYRSSSSSSFRSFSGGRR